MANWITHTILADKLLARGLPLDEKAFCIGSIAPDCNVENTDWSSFTPTRETTHWMTGNSKSSADFNGFWENHIHGHTFANAEEQAYLLGYFAHLVTDVLYQDFVRDPARMFACYDRLHSISWSSSQIAGLPETMDTLKKIFGKRRIFRDIAILENNYVAAHPPLFLCPYLAKNNFLPGLSGYFS